MVVFCSLGVKAQKFKYFHSHFVMKEKNTFDSTTTLVLGKVTYDKNEDKIIFDLNFPEIQKWVFQDTTLYKYGNDSILKEVVVGKFGELSIFKEILEVKDNDFGLKKVGFVIDKVEQAGKETIVYWKPPTQMATFLKSATTVVEDNLLRSIFFTDVDDKVINSSYFDEYKIIKGLPVPCKIQSRWKGQKQEIFKILTFDQVEIK